MGGGGGGGGGGGASNVCATISSLAYVIITRFFNHNFTSRTGYRHQFQ